MYRVLVLVKQVPDTKNVSEEAMNADGTINRAALPAIFNPEDLHALEMALNFKDKTETEIHVLSMGLVSASEVLRETLFRGADHAYLLNDRRFAGADTIATSYALSKAIEKIGNIDLIFAGRQAIDGDTAQVGPQVAKDLNLPQITYAEELISIEGKSLTLKRQIENGFEIIKGQMPLVVTVVDTAPHIRPRSIESMIFKRKSPIFIWNLEDIQADPQHTGMNGSPTNVHKIANVSFQNNNRKTHQVEISETGFDDLLAALIADRSVEEWKYE